MYEKIRPIGAPTIVKVVPISLMAREVYALDEAGNVWRKIEGIDETWRLFKPAANNK
jgi:hypothetical protein